MSDGAVAMMAVAILLVWGGLVAAILQLRRHPDRPEPDEPDPGLGGPGSGPPGGTDPGPGGPGV